MLSAGLRLGALVLTLGSAALLSASCSSDPSAKPAGEQKPGGGSGFGSSGEPDGAGGSACATQEAEPDPSSRPVDIIFLIDNSVSMSEEIGEVERQINDNFAAIIGASNIDYRVIMLSNHGSHGPGNPIQKICVKAPLSGTNCSPIPAKPAETARFFQYDALINSQDSLCQILATYRAPDKSGTHPKGWADLLRVPAFKVFAVITDDRVSAGPCSGWPKFDDKTNDKVSAKTTAETFQNALYVLDPTQFGNQARRNFVWHSIVGVAPFDAGDPTKPYPPSAELNAEICEPGSVAAGLGYQALSKLSGGLRYPTCGLDYTTIFKAMAEGVIFGASLPCEYAVPTSSKEGTKIDPASATIRFTKEGQTTTFTQVPNAEACAPEKFFIENERIKLCPDACVLVQSNPGAELKVLYACLPSAE